MTDSVDVGRPASTKRAPHAASADTNAKQKIKRKAKTTMLL